MTELLPLKAKRRIWSLRRRGLSFSSIFRRATKDGVPEGRWRTQMYEKKRRNFRHSANFYFKISFNVRHPSTAHFVRAGIWAIS